MQIHHYTNMFQAQVVQRTLDVIDSQVDHLRQLNHTMIDNRDAILSLIHFQLETVEAPLVRALADIRVFAEHIEAYREQVEHYAGVDNRMTSSQHRLSALADRVTWLAMTSLVTTTNTLRSRGIKLRAAWRTALSTVSNIWSRLVDDELLRNFYLNLYNDVTAVTKHPNRIVDILRSLVESGRLTMPHATLDNGTRYHPTDLYTVLNADVQVIDMHVKMATIKSEFRLSEIKSDAELVLGHLPDVSLEVAHRSLANRLTAFQAAECQLNNELIRYDGLLAFLQQNQTEYC